MKRCAAIEPLLLLHREGERTAEETRNVEEHLAACPSCRALAADLLKQDRALRVVRETAPAAAPPVGDIVHAVLQHRRPSDGDRERESAAMLFDRIFIGFRIAVAALIALFLVQQVRDLGMVRTLERELQAEGRISRGDDGRKLLAAAARRDETALLALARAADPASSIREGLGSLFGRQDGLFQDFAKRYPNLATIALSDGLDAHEREVLATEGRAFLKDFDELLKKGAR